MRSTIRQARQFQDGRMSFDYRLRVGIFEKSNALGLMRSVGLDIPETQGNTL